MALFADLLAAIPAYTGLSPVLFFTITAMSIALYYIVSGSFAAPKHSSYVQMEPPPPPVQLGEVTEEVLGEYDGSDPKKPLLMAIKGQIYDVSQSRMFYGPGGPYELFAGKDASRALAKMSFEDQDLNGNLEGLSAYELDTLHDWEWKFGSKYVKVGHVKSMNNTTREVPVTDAEDTKRSGEMKADDESQMDAESGKVKAVADERKLEVASGEVNADSDESKIDADLATVADEVEEHQKSEEIKLE